MAVRVRAAAPVHEQGGGARASCGGGAQAARQRASRLRRPPSPCAPTKLTMAIAMAGAERRATEGDRGGDGERLGHGGLELRRGQGLPPPGCCSTTTPSRSAPAALCRQSASARGRRGGVGDLAQPRHRLRLLLGAPRRPGDSRQAPPLNHGIAFYHGVMRPGDTWLAPQVLDET